jgi:hypothetical protein
MHRKDQTGNCQEAEQHTFDLIRSRELVQPKIDEHYTENDFNQPDHKSESCQITSAKEMLQDNKPQPRYKENRQH